MSTHVRSSIYSQLSKRSVAALPVTFLQIDTGINFITHNNHLGQNFFIS